MSECVVRMEMPKDCEACPMCGTASGGNGMYKLWCMCGDIPASSQRRPKDCPIICSLPEGHGRLVDADALHKIAWPVKDHTGRIEECVQMRDLYKAPTIVPADTEERMKTV